MGFYELHIFWIGLHFMHQSDLHRNHHPEVNFPSLFIFLHAYIHDALRTMHEISVEESLLMQIF